MPNKRVTFDPDDLRRAYYAGERAASVAKRYGCSNITVYSRWHDLHCVGRRFNSPARLILPDEKICSRYLAGESELALAHAYATSRNVIRTRLLEAGIQPRGGSEANKIRMAKLSKQERQTLAAAAHEAVRGKRQSLEVRCKMAATRELRASPNPAERLMIESLTALGLACIPQKAVGPYNVDIAVTRPRVAVEIFGGHWHASGRAAARFPKRIEYLRRAGWAVVCIWVTGSWPLESGAIKYVAALAQTLCHDPAPRSQDHMIRGDGQPSTIGYFNLNNIPGIPGAQPRDNRTGRFEARII